MGGPIQFRLKSPWALLSPWGGHIPYRGYYSLSLYRPQYERRMGERLYPPTVSQFFTNRGRKTVHMNFLFFNDEGCKTMEDSKALHEVEGEFSYKKWKVCFTTIDTLNLNGFESIVTLSPFGPIEGHKWFFQISRQEEFQKIRFAFVSFGKIRFLLPCIWDLPFMSYRLWA